MIHANARPLLPLFLYALQPTQKKKYVNKKKTHPQTNENKESLNCITTKSKESCKDEIARYRRCKEEEGRERLRRNGGGR